MFCRTLCDNRHRWWRVKIFKRLWMTWWQPQTTPIFITIRVTTTGNENLEPCGSGYKKQILYLTEGGGRIPLRLVHELSKGLILNNLHVLSLQWFACFLLIWPKWDCLFGFLCFWYPLFLNQLKSHVKISLWRSGFTLQKKKIISVKTYLELTSFLGDQSHGFDRIFWFYAHDHKYVC